MFSGLKDTPKQVLSGLKLHRNLGLMNTPEEVFSGLRDTPKQVLSGLKDAPKQVFEAKNGTETGVLRP